VTPLKLAAFVVGSLAFAAGGMGIGVPVGFAQPAIARAQPAARPARAEAPPPIPFRYIGRMIEDGKLEVFLVRGEEHFSVAAGDMLGADYRVEAVTDSEVVLVYLPLNARQSLPL
jgi:hypothetical protein